MSLVHRAYLFDVVMRKLNSMAVRISFQRTDVDSDSCPHTLSSCVRDKSRETEWLARRYLLILVQWYVGVRVSLVTEWWLQPLFFLLLWKWSIFMGGICASQLCRKCVWQPAVSFAEPLLGFWGFLQSQAASSASAAPLQSFSPSEPSRWELGASWCLMAGSVLELPTCFLGKPGKPGITRDHTEVPL